MADEHSTSPTLISDSDIFWSIKVSSRPMQRQNMNVNAQKLQQCHLLAFDWWLPEQIWILCIAWFAWITTWSAVITMTAVDLCLIG